MNLSDFYSVPHEEAGPVTNPVPLVLDLRIALNASEVPLTLVLMETYTTLMI